MTVKKHKYTLKWPEGASFQMDEKSINEIRNSLEMQFKQIIYSQPGFRYFQSMGSTNFFQAFKTNDGIDFGVGHLYWDKKAVDNIDYVDADGNIVDKQKGGWRFRWLPAGCFEPVGDPSVISEKGHQIIAQEFARRIQKVMKANVEVQEDEQINEEALEDMPKHLLN